MDLTRALRGNDRGTVFDRLTREAAPAPRDQLAAIPGLSDELVLWLDRAIPYPDGSPGVPEAEFRYRAGARSVVSLLASALEAQKRAEEARERAAIQGLPGVT